MNPPSIFVTSGGFRQIPAIAFVVVVIEFAARDGMVRTSRPRQPRSLGIVLPRAFPGVTTTTTTTTTTETLHVPGNGGAFSHRTGKAGGLQYGVISYFWQFSGKLRNIQKILTKM